jgi:hypothetical protein
MTTVKPQQPQRLVHISISSQRHPVALMSSSVVAEAARNFVNQHYDLSSMIRQNSTPPAPQKKTLSREASASSPPPGAAVSKAHIFAMAYYRAVVMDIVERWALVHSNLRQQAVREFTNSYIESRVTAVGLRLASRLTDPPTPLNESLDIVREEVAKIHCKTLVRWAIESVIRRKFPEKVVLELSSPKEIQELEEVVKKSKSLGKAYAMSDFCNSYYEFMLYQVAHDYVCQQLGVDPTTMRCEVSKELPEIMEPDTSVVKDFVESYLSVRTGTVIQGLLLTKKAKEVFMKNYLKQSYNNAISSASRKKKLGIVRVEKKDSKKSLIDSSPVAINFQTAKPSPKRPIPNLFSNPSTSIPAPKSAVVQSEEKKTPAVELDNKIQLEIRRQQVNNFNRFVVAFLVLWFVLSVLNK